MGRLIDYKSAREILQTSFEEAEGNFRERIAPEVPEEIDRAIAALFSSRTQSYREALIGCALARMIDQDIDIRLPYMNQGNDAFNGRTLDERVVNPFLHEKQIPCSRGPFLAAFRRNVRFEPETERGLRDREGFRQMLVFIEHLRAADSESARALLHRLLRGFVELRDASEIALTRIARLSVEQHEVLLDGLLATPSGGRMPVLFVVAMLRTLSECYGMGWQIEWQGINVADAASGASGDVTVRRGGEVVLAVEVTERTVDRARVIATFRAKIGPQGLDDYLFFFSGPAPENGARAMARQYFAAGHEINFVNVRDWIVTTLTTIGPRCRALFAERFLELLGDRAVPAALKLAWNDRIAAILE